MSYRAAKFQASCWDTELRSVSRFICTQQGGPDYWQKTMQVMRQHVDFLGGCK